MNDKADEGFKAPEAFENAVHRLGGYRAEPWKAIFNAGAKQGYRDDEVSVASSGDLTGNRFFINQFTDWEIDAIRREANSLYAMPEPIVPIPDRAGLPPVSSHHSVLYRFNNGPEEAVFYVERALVPGFDELGKPRKRYIPWCYRRGKGWDKTEPNISLPLFGGDRLRDLPRSKVMVHEGPKAARAAQLIAASGPGYENHPWRRAMGEYIHVAWHGSKRGVGRTRWTDLRGREVYIMADLDEAGDEISKLVGDAILRAGGGKVYRSIWSKEYQDKYPSWDIADPLMNDLATDRPMTSGTFRSFFKRHRLVQDVSYVRGVDGKMKKRVALRKDFAESFIYVKKTKSFHSIDNPSDATDNQLMALVYRSLHPDIDNLVEAMMSSSYLEIVEQTTMAPGRGLLVDEKIQGKYQRALNMYVSPNIKRQQGSIRPMLRLMMRVIPKKSDRRFVMRWMAHMVCCPQKKILWAVMLISETQGIGKTTLINMLAHMIGEWNMYSISARKVVEGSFSSYAASTLLLNLVEMEEAADRRSYNALKDKITDEVIEVEKKFQDSFTQPNRMNVIASSNYKNPLSLEDTDRRWFITESEVKTALPTDEALRVRRWFYEEGGDSHVLWYCARWFASWTNRVTSSDAEIRQGALREFDPTKPPESDKKKELITKSKFQWQTSIDELLDGMADDVTFMVPDVVQYLMEMKVRAPGKSSVIADYLTRTKDYQLVNGNKTHIRGIGNKELYSRTPSMPEKAAADNLRIFSKSTTELFERLRGQAQMDAVAGARKG